MIDRAELFRLLGDDDRLRVLALCREEELTVSELAELLHESQPQLTRKTQPLRQAGLLTERKDGVRTYLRAPPSDDAVVEDAVGHGRRLAEKARALARLPRLLLAREERSRSYFAGLGTGEETASALAPSPLGRWLPLMRPLLGPRAQGLCVDVGAGDGALLPLLSPLFGRVLAVDRSPARLAACARVVSDAGLMNVRLLEGDATDPVVYEACFRAGGAAVVVVARTLHHAARPQDLLAACTRLLRDDGVVLVADYLPHDDERRRERGDVWLGFSREALAAHCASAGLAVLGDGPLPSLTADNDSSDDSHLPWQWLLAQKGAADAPVSTLH
jgi:ArsR family transcriptional regulator